MNQAPDTFQCRCPLADGSLLTLTATRRPRAGRAELKCAVPDDPRLAAQMQQLVRLARLTEPSFDSRDQVVLSLDRRPPDGDRGWELAAVLADRMVRGLLRPRSALLANGWSDAWECGRVDGNTLEAAARALPADAVLGGPGGLPHLGLLSGHADPAAAVSSARAWFPLHSGEEGGLGWVEVSVHPLARHAGQAAPDEEQAIAAPGQDAARQLAVRQVLAGARHFDGRALGRWRTVVRFGPEAFAGNSWELALVMADRLARGREFVPRGRLIASGCSSAWHAGRVDTVAGVEPKCALLLREAGPGDRILLPRAWHEQLPAGFMEQLRAQGASAACVERIGII
ncbi:hypothetical protein AB595_04565 [Massilia sp. WF1]|uniref:hypothetical protein n=1 Tax=unclassified Massilia TaxID=2609279 RepID=UPI00064A8732|nr:MULTISPECIES: hypothetical protein [unclassified Massilia]ALK96951.1 hypothetical protein AM586_12470 [Massilia sp. WG5]KLU37904.1 hypothetical protein AB595_04565 [Massilia sp. WF1]